MRTKSHNISQMTLEPLGSERHRPWPVRGERAGANESIEATVLHYKESLMRTGHANYPRREWSRQESSDMDLSPEGVSEWERTNQSKQTYCVTE
jgi:hypothetical protein